MTYTTHTKKHQANKIVPGKDGYTLFIIYKFAMRCITYMDIIYSH